MITTNSLEVRPSHFYCHVFGFIAGFAVGLCVAGMVVLAVANN